MPVLHNIAQLATCPRGNPQNDAGLIANAAIAWEEDIIRWVGHAPDLPPEFRNEPSIDCEQRLVIPGLIDCHTHLCFGGWRGDEFALRIAGATYQEIAEAGGGINSTVTATRAASLGQLRRKAATILDRMLELGITTVECKSGYGLDLANELKQLEVYRQLNQAHVVDLIPTFLGAHVVPKEHTGSRDRYIDLLCNELIPMIARENLALFCDAFIEDGAFTGSEARRILSCAASHGLGIKIHADQLSTGGGAELAAELRAVSAEHLEYISDEGIEALAQSGTVAVSLPLASCYLDEAYIPARKLISAGVPVAVATDFNPGSAPSFHLPLAMTLACIHQRMTPEEVLNGVTTVAARAVCADDRIGSLLPGFRADLALIDAPSLNHWLYHFVPNACLKVLKNGKWI
ncbi:MAG: imidazolonepropionase [Xanthomonadales bacterium]|nr:imidazolonepropionase [Gammaproteobacteria bacterium]NND56339.1 imidazolonepropionase [Xanthomonadales bacterium]